VPYSLRRRETARVTQWVATNQPMMLMSTPAIAEKNTFERTWERLPHHPTAR
jgi:hypothetical protein